MQRMIVLIAVLSTLSFGGGFYLYYWALSPVNPDAPAEILVTIEKGASVQAVANQLVDQGLIRNRLAFSKYLKRNGLDRKITAGRFYLSPSMSVAEIVRHITLAPSQRLAIIIPPGSTLKQIKEIIISRRLTTEPELAALLADQQLEGYLFPDTYFVEAISFTPASFFSVLRQNFESKTAELQQEAVRRGKDWSAVVILASILEREIKTPEDLAVVSGILWKRLEAGWPLGADATLLYDDPDGSLGVEDLQRDSPYNTRVRPGLPPTPIANPGWASLQAALQPKPTPYWFYLTETTAGKVIYAKTREEHERNVTRYLH